MSYVTNIMLNVGISEDDKTKEINQFFEEDGQRGFIELDGEGLELNQKYWYGGSKALEVTLYVGAFNYIDLEGLKTHLRTINWAFPESVQLIICDQDDDKWHIWELEALQDNK